MGVNVGYLTAGRGTASDNCLTPAYAVRPLVKYIKQRGYNSIWCPFDLASSKFVTVLSKAGFDVTSTHIDKDENFFDLVHYEVVKDEIDCIISNPPYSCKDRVLEVLYLLGKPFAMLLPQNTLQGALRTKLFIDYELEYLGFDKRICYYTSGYTKGVATGNSFASGYFCYKMLPKLLMFEQLDTENVSYEEVD